jgi:drug/metabolite transporter (DMT)-like permease
VNTIAQTLHVSTKVVQELQLPMVLIVGQHRLGLGDIVLPGILLTYALKIDTHFKQMAPFWNGYFLLGLCGYLIGFQCAFIALTYYEYSNTSISSQM